MAARIGGESADDEIVDPIAVDVARRATEWPEKSS
jgi:hypothetical protein